MSDLEPDPPSDEILAGEYALGVLDRQARRAAEARSESDPVFAGEVFSWILRLAGLVDAAPPQTPSEGLWDRIEAALPPPAARDFQPAPLAANDESPSRLGLWRAWSFAASAVAACALLALGWLTLSGAGKGPLHGPQSAGPTLVAALGLKDGGAVALTVAYDPGRATIYASPDTEFSIPRARSAELWLVPADGKPRAVGLIDPSRPATVEMPAEVRPLAKETAVLALSIEPAGGSKTGAPTGPVVAAGTLKAV